MIIAKEIYKSFGNKEILKGCSFSIKRGEAVGLVGLNGAGKTTLIRIILSLLKPDSGSISVFGNRKVGGELFRDCGVTLEGSAFNQNLSFRDNIDFFIAAKRGDREESYKFIDKYFSHIISKNGAMRDFSRGQRATASLARAFLLNPSLIILDEPTETLDINGIKLFHQLVSDSSRRGATVIISSHQLSTIESLCSSVIFLEKGLTKKIDIKTDSLNSYSVNCNNSLLMTEIAKELNLFIENNKNSLTVNSTTKEIISKLITDYTAKGGEIYEVAIISRLKSKVNYV